MQVGRGARERGAAVVEFALVIPVLMMLIVGMVSSGILYNQQMQLTHAAREGARYGATVSPDETFNSGTWATNIQKVVVDRAGGELTASQVCVALVDDAPPLTPGPPVALGPNWTTAGGKAPCFDDSGGGDAGKRVQVKVDKPGTLDAVFLHIDLSLGAKATAQHED